MARFHRIASDLNIAPLLTKLQAHPHLWAERTERQTYPDSAHKETETIFLRWAKDQSVFGGFHCLESEDHVETVKKLAPEVADLCIAACERILGRPVNDDDDFGRIILTRMKPGAQIPEHIDEGPYADKYERFHVCLSGRSFFMVDEDANSTWAGDLFWFNHKLPHSVENMTDERIHLIIDLVAPAYRWKRGLTFQRERAHELLTEARPLFEQHYLEVAHYQDIPLDINEDLYRETEESGALRVFTARDCGELIGYGVYVVKRNPRYWGSVQAVQDLLFVDKSRRGALVGKRLNEFSYQRLKAEGVQVVYQHCKAKDEKTVGRFLEVTGHELIDLIYGIRLDR